MVSIDSRLAGQELSTATDVLAWLTALGEEKPAGEAAMIRNAYDLADAAHGGQQRASGEPYINHAVAVADILVSLQLDHETIAAAILHDVVEDTDITLAQIESDFGAAVAHLVDGVTKMSVIESQSGVLDKSARAHARAESLRKMLLAMAEDVRVVLIKLADRLHNMRTLKFLSEEKQRRIARETLDIYAPLANRLGIWQIKWELEDLAFRYLEPGTYKQIASLLDERRIDRERYIQQVITRLDTSLREHGVEAQISGRPKHIYSIWRKMQRKRITYHELNDVRAVRILVDSIAQCYAVLGVVHTLWRHVPREFDDYIATPKENMYQSIHTAVVGPQGKTLEVQIRTHNMHEHAELGVAAHWTYKEGGARDIGYEQKIAWLRQLLEWRDEAADAGDFIDRFKSEVFQDRVYVLTPEGDIVDLAQGATPLDFAYHIHTEVGHRCRGARVNGHIVSLSYTLKSGDQVEVLTAKQGAPSRDWLNPHLGYLGTSRARAKVRHWFKQQDQAKNATAGRAILERELHRLGIEGLAYSALAARFKFQNVDELFVALGRGDLNSSQLGSVALELIQPEKDEDRIEISPRRTRRKQVTGDVSIQGVGNLLTRLAKCCKPAPGDAIVGFITRGQGVTIHRRDCSNVLTMDDKQRVRLIAVDWSGQAYNTYPVDISVEAIDRQGLLRDITLVLANEKINVLAVNTQSNTDDNTAVMQLTLEISDVSELSRVLNRIGQLPNVFEARRKAR